MSLQGPNPQGEWIINMKLDQSSVILYPAKRLANIFRQNSSGKLFSKETLKYFGILIEIHIGMNLCSCFFFFFKKEGGSKTRATSI